MKVVASYFAYGHPEHKGARLGNVRNQMISIGFACDSPEKVKAFHDAGVASGGNSIEDPPGWREGAAGKLYLAYLRDPSGNKICALHRPG